MRPGADRTIMDNKEAKEILTRYRLGRCTDTEKAWVEDWYLKLNQTDEALSGDRLTAATDRVWQRLEKLGKAEGVSQPLPKFPHTTTPGRQRKITRFWSAA